MITLTAGILHGDVGTGSEALGSSLGDEIDIRFRVGVSFNKPNNLILFFEFVRKNETFGNGPPFGNVAKKQIEVISFLKLLFKADGNRLFRQTRKSSAGALPSNSTKTAFFANETVFQL